MQAKGLPQDVRELIFPSIFKTSNDKPSSEILDLISSHKNHLYKLVRQRSGYKIGVAKYQIKPEAKWAVDGRGIDVEDIKYTIELGKQLGENSTNPHLFANIKKFKKLSNTTFELVFYQPFLPDIFLPEFELIRAEKAQKALTDIEAFLAENNGDFEIPASQGTIVKKRNTLLIRTPKNEMDIRCHPNIPNLIANFKAKAFEWMPDHSHLGPYWYHNTLKRHPEIFANDYIHVFKPGRWIEVLYFNHRNEGYANLDVRRAIAHSIDKNTLIEEHDMLLPTPGVISPDHKFFNPGTYFYEYDPKLTKTLLRSANWNIAKPSGRGRFLTELAFPKDNPLRSAMATQIKELLKGSGVAVKLRPTSQSIYLKQVLSKGNFSGLALASIEISPFTNLLALLDHRRNPSRHTPPQETGHSISGISMNIGHFIDYKTVELITSSNRSLNMEQFAKRHSKLQDSIAIKLPFYPLFVYPRVGFYNRDKGKVAAKPAPKELH